VNPVNDFYRKLEYSRGEREKNDIDILRRIIPQCVSVEKTGIEEDKAGVDYVAILKCGAKIRIDAKTREKGCSKWWKHGEPEIALEKASVIKGGKMVKIGWTLDTKKEVDEILYTFDIEDSDRIYRLPFQILRTVFWNHGKEWQEKYGLKYQDSGGWKSSAIFIPISEVINAINGEMVQGVRI